jgi:hypothetical protein
VLVYQYLTQNLELVQYLARAADNATKGIIGQMHVHFRPSRQQIGQTRQQ